MRTRIAEATATGILSMVSAGSSVVFALADAVLISIVTSIAAVLMAAVSAFFAYKAKTISTATHDIVNSRMTEFMEMAKKFYRGEGRIEGKAEEKAAQAGKDRAAANNHARIVG